MQVTSRNIKQFVTRYVELGKVDVKGLKHNPEKDIKLKRMANKFVWEAIFSEQDKGNKGKNVYMYIDAVSAEVTVRDLRNL